MEAGAGRSPDAVLLAEASFILFLPDFFEASGGGELLPSLEMLSPSLLKKSPIGFAGARGALMAKQITSALKINRVTIACSGGRHQGCESRLFKESATPQE